MKYNANFKRIVDEQLLEDTFVLDAENSEEALDKLVKIAISDYNIVGWDKIVEIKIWEQA
jgi:hypothetical protein